MFGSKSGFVFGLMSVAALSGLAQNAMAFGLGGNTLASIAVIGPKGEIISYEKNGDSIMIRKCAKNSLKSDVESNTGCDLEEGATQVTMTEAAFRSFVKFKLPKLNKADLSNEQKVLLERALSPHPGVDEDQKALEALEKKLAKNQAFKKENPQDYDSAEEKDLNAQITCIQDRQKDYGPILKAKKEVSGLITALIGDMPEKRIKRALKHSSDRSGIAFNLLRDIVSTENCSPEKTATLAVGAVCMTSNGSPWQIETRVAGHTVIRDLKSGLLVSDRVADRRNQYDAEKLCKDDASLAARGNLKNAKWTLPTGYPKNQNGQNGFPNKDSDFVTLEANGVREVANMKDRWFPSSSVHPNYADGAYFFSGDDGDVGNVYRGYADGDVSVVCVGR